MTTGHDKKLIAMRYFLLGAAEQNAQFRLPLRVFELAVDRVEGLRKDNITPEVAHPISVGHLVRTLPGLIHRPATLALCFAHDLVEDGFATLDEIAAFGNDLLARDTERITKKRNGIKRSPEDCFHSMGEGPLSSIVKPADRCDNLRTSGVAGWTVEKRRSYAAEVDDWFLPMLKVARRRFPEQEAAYEMLKLNLTNQRDLILSLLPDPTATDGTGLAM